MLYRSIGCIGLGLLTSVAIGLAAEPAAKSPGWPQFRGPLRDGKSTETGLLQEWPKDGPPLAWRAEGLGIGYSSLSFAGDKIFLMGNHDKAQCVVALDRATHQPAWITPIGREYHDGPRCTPTWDDGRLYVLDAHGEFACLSADKGAILWRKSFTKDFGGKMMSDFGYSESPLVDGDKVICTPGGMDAAMVAMDKRTGEVRWKLPMPNLGPNGRDGAGYTSMVVANACGIRQYVQMLGRGAVGVAAEDGRLLWGYNRMTNIYAVIASPLVDGDNVFVTTAYDTGSALLKLAPAADGKKIDASEEYFLEATEFANHHGGVVLVDGCVYGGHGQNNGIVTCIDFKSGQIKWKQRGPGRGSAAFLYADGRLYVRYEDGVMALVEPNPKELKIHGQFKLPTTRNGPSWPYPAILEGMLYLRHGDALLCYDVRQKAN